MNSSHENEESLRLQYEKEIQQLYKDMGTRIKNRRKEQGYTQEELAELLFASPTHLSSVENGKSCLSFLRFFVLCIVLETNPDYFMFGNLYAKDIPASIYENLQLCKDDDIEMVRHLVSYLVEKRPSRKEQR